MKKIFVFSVFIVSLFILSCNQPNKTITSTEQDKLEEIVSGTIKISGSSTMYNMMQILAQEYMKANPKVKISISGISSNAGIKNLLNGKADIAMVSRYETENEKTQGLFFVPIAKDAVVPIISFDNPLIQKIVLKGISKDKLKDIFSGKLLSWGKALKINNSSVIHVIVRNDTCGTNDVWADFLGINPSELKATNKVGSEKIVIDNISKDPMAIGFCSMSNAFNLTTGYRADGIYILPIDFNNNNQLDDNEAIYDNYKLFIDAVNTGKYPYPPSRDLNLVTKTKPTDKLILNFIKWALTLGQNYIQTSGNIFIQKENAQLTLESLK